MQRKKQNFIQGAVILMIASLVVKVIGAFFQIPLQNMIGGESSPAFGLFSAAYRIYTAMLVISTVGLPAALSKMVAEATACGREREVRRIVRVAAGIFVPVGVLATVVLFFGADTFAGWIKNPDARLAVMAIAPSVAMVAILSVFRGYYQGRANMVPTAVSQVIEAMGKLFAGLGLAYYAKQLGLDDPMVAALTVLGVTLGEVVAAGYMLVQAGITRRRSEPVHLLSDAVRPTRELAKTLLSLSIPITISSAVMSLTDLIDVALISARLQSPAVGMTAEAATTAYGIYTGNAVNFFNLPQTLITALAVSVLPTIASARAAQNFTKVSKTMATAMRLTMIITLPAGAGFLLLSGPILRMFYSEGTVLGGQLMAILGFAVPAVALVAITNAVLQAFGRIDLPLISMFLGALVKIFGDYVLIGMPELNIAGAPISTAVCYWLIALINLFHIGRLSHALPPLGKTAGRPFAATVGMGAATYLCHTVLLRVLDAAPGTVLDKLVTLASIAVAVVVYVVLLLLLHAVEREDVLLLPKGEKLANILHLK
ncbi:putative polysaccharide biosynthesis protein [Agathobaculum sp. Marseille-P7918]|uniref:putative polysaccharide biosynthesis protein n=1 Tax=Agathobaculum sp. Marseille-P7918 TaxID=2479843 RepID=UPI000F62D047|nr:polysaccharide biosynthesis protein [Agathobaculum sp. Marseille-P7918]